MPERLSKDEIATLVLQTWSRLVAMAPSELEEKRSELASLIEGTERRLSSDYPPADKTFVVELLATILTDGLARMGSANVWSDTPSRLWRDLFDDTVNPTLQVLEALAPSERVKVLASIVPLLKTFFRQSGPQLGRDEVEEDAEEITERIGKVWGWSSMEGPDLFPAAIDATCSMVEGMIRRAGGPPFDASQATFAIDTIHSKVDRCVTHALQKGESQDSIRERLKAVTAAVLRKVLALDHPPFFRDQIASAFGQQWEGSFA